MKTIALDENKNITFGAFKDKESDIFKIKIRVMDDNSLEKKGCIIEFPMELLNLLEEVPAGKSYPRYQLLDLIKNKGTG